MRGLLLVVALVGTGGGVALLMAAFNRAKVGDRAGERVRFRTAVAAFALGSLALLGSTVLAP